MFGCTGSHNATSTSPSRSSTALRNELVLLALQRLTVNSMS
ncbi:hypothetical protein [Streptomyces hokutonensis]